MQVSVRDNNVDQALRALKKKLQREGVFREMKLKQHFEKPSEKKARAEGRRPSVVLVSWRARKLNVSRHDVTHPSGRRAPIHNENPYVSVGVFLFNLKW